MKLTKRQLTRRYMSYDLHLLEYLGLISLKTFAARTGLSERSLYNTFVTKCDHAGYKLFPAMDNLEEKAFELVSHVEQFVAMNQYGDTIEGSYREICDELGGFDLADAAGHYSRKVLMQGYILIPARACPILSFQDAMAEIAEHPGSTREFVEVDTGEAIEVTNSEIAELLNLSKSEMKKLMKGFVVAGYQLADYEPLDIAKTPHLVSYEVMDTQTCEVWSGTRAEFLNLCPMSKDSASALFNHGKVVKGYQLLENYNQDKSQMKTETIYRIINTQTCEVWSITRSEFLNLIPMASASASALLNHGKVVKGYQLLEEYKKSPRSEAPVNLPNYDKVINRENDQGHFLEFEPQADTGSANRLKNILETCYDLPSNGTKAQVRRLRL